IVVRAAAQSLIPLVAAIGHETDWTLIDHVADIRAPTPTAAAELSAPVRAELLATLADLESRRRGAILRLGERARAALRAAARSRFDVQQLARTAQAQTRLQRAVETALAQRRQRLAGVTQLLNAVSYRNVLGRGFALVRESAGGQPVRNAADISAGQALRIE